MSSRDQILNKLRAARQPFEDAPPRPAKYLDVTLLDDTSRDALIERFSAELTRLMGEPFIVEGDEAACDCVLTLLKQHEAKRILAWDFAHIPVKGLKDAIKSAGIEIHHPETHDEFRAEILDAAEGAQVGITGADYAAAATGTLIFTTGAGKGRIPTVLAPVHIAIINADQVLPRIEDWVAKNRADNMGNFSSAANFCFVSGPSRTGDIEMELILGVHGPGKVQVIIKK